MPRCASGRSSGRAAPAGPRSGCPLVANPPRRFGASRAAARRPVAGSMSPAGVHPVAEPGPSLSRVKRRLFVVVGDRAPHEGPRAVLGGALDPLRYGLGAPLSDGCLGACPARVGPISVASGRPAPVGARRGRALPLPGHRARPSPHPATGARQAPRLYELRCYFKSRRAVHGGALYAPGRSLPVLIRRIRAPTT